MITQEEFVWFVEMGGLTNRQALYLRLNVGIDDAPLKQAEIARRFGVSHQAVSCVVGTAKRKVCACPFAPDRIDGPRHRASSYNPGSGYRGVMTVRKAEKIIGRPVSVSGPKNGFVRVGCYDVFGQSLYETARNIPAALELLIRANYASSRLFVLRRDRYRCFNCGAFRAGHCGHLSGRSTGPSQTPENMFALCRGCYWGF
jgi:hypothetical protein